MEMKKSKMYMTNFVRGLSDSELKEMFLEYVNYNKKGILPVDAKIRQLRNKIAASMNNDEFWDIGCNFTCNTITYEIARRFYNI